MTKGRVFLYSILFLITLLILFNRKLVYYGYVQARGQLNIIWNSRPVDEFLNDPDFPDSLKAKLKIIEEVKVFAVNNLGLRGIDNYTTYYDQNGKDLMWVVSGCEPFKLESYQWGFPILGTFSYKGFFKYDMAVEEMGKLRKKGFDANIRTAGGWSTLGILNDPILSNMLDRSDGSLSDLIIHELTHGTIFIKDSIEFNENLASFIGNTGATIFLTNRFGESSNEQEAYYKKVEDREKFTHYVLNGASMLDSLYNTFAKEMSYEEKSELKQLAINKFVLQSNSIQYNYDEYNRYFEDFIPDNTFFMSFLRYRGGQDIFEEVLQKEYNGDLPAYIAALKKQYGR